MPDLARIAAAIAAAYIPPQTGRPSSIADQETLLDFFTAVQDGNYVETAAELSGISYETIRTWHKRAEAGEEPYKTFSAAVKKLERIAEAKEVSKVRKAGEDPRFWAASMTYLERRHPERWARRQDGNDGPKVVVQIGVRDSDVQVTVQSAPQVNVIDTYQTQMLGEGETSQSLTAPYSGATEAKVIGER